MPVYFRLHGYIKPVETQLFSEIKYLLDDMDSYLDGKELHFHHEGDYIDMDFILEKISRYFSKDITAILDCIDMQDWKMERITWIQDKWERKKIHLNEILEKKNYEQSG